MAAQRGADLYDRIAFTWLPISDVARARRFYEVTLGLQVGSHGGAGAMAWIEYDLPGGGCRALFNGVPETLPGGSVVFEVMDLDGEVARLRDLGVAFDADVIHSPLCRMIPLRDPDGNRLMLYQLRDQTRLQPASYGLIGKLTAQPGRGAELAAILRTGCAATPGCKAYRVAVEATDPDVLWVTERLVSRALHAASLQLPAVQAAIAAGRPLIASMARVAETTG